MVTPIVQSSKFPVIETEFVDSIRPTSSRVASMMRNDKTVIKRSGLNIIGGHDMLPTTSHTRHRQHTNPDSQSIDEIVLPNADPQINVVNVLGELNYPDFIMEPNK